jgi:hypothetical protein
MQALKTHVAGVDVHKEVLAITVLIGKTDEEPVATHFECGTFTEDLMKCGLRLKDMGVTDVAMSRSYEKVVLPLKIQQALFPSWLKEQGKGRDCKQACKSDLQSFSRREIQGSWLSAGRPKRAKDQEFTRAVKSARCEYGLPKPRTYQR